MKQISYASQKNLHNSLKNPQKLLQNHKKPHALFSNDLDIPKDLSTLFENLTASFRQDVQSKGPMYNFTRRKKRRKATKSATGHICLLPRTAHSVKGLFLCLFFQKGFGNAPFIAKAPRFDTPTSNFTAMKMYQGSFFWCQHFSDVGHVISPVPWLVVVQPPEDPKLVFLKMHPSNKNQWE